MSSCRQYVVTLISTVDSVKAMNSESFRCFPHLVESTEHPYRGSPDYNSAVCLCHLGLQALRWIVGKVSTARAGNKRVERIVCQAINVNTLNFDFPEFQYLLWKVASDRPQKILGRALKACVLHQLVPRDCIMVSQPGRLLQVVGHL